jgi:uncharacterized protein YndB with AHSA1/START domain
MTQTDEPSDEVVVRRVLAASREEVFAAWLDPASLAQWMRPGAVASALVEVDPRVGGKFRIVMRHATGEVEHWGEYLTIDPPSLLFFTWISVNTDLLPTHVTVELHERGASTVLVLTHRRLPPRKLDAHRKGWTDISQKLGEVLAR